MQWVSTLSTAVSLEAAVNDLAMQVQRGDRPLSRPWSVGLLFASSSFGSDFPRLLPLLAERLPVAQLVGCSGGGIVGSGQELEGVPALSLLVGDVPGAILQGFHLEENQVPDLDSPPQRWHEAIGVNPTLTPDFVLLADPFSFPISDFLSGLDFAYPQSVKVGGLAGGGMGQNALFANGRLYRSGLVGLAVAGSLKLDAVVAQGCRPIGKPMYVSKCERNILLAVDDRPPLEVLQETVAGLSEGDQRLAQHSLFLGLVNDEFFKQEVGPGDYLIRNILGGDPQTGAIAIADRLRPGQRVQWHLRDAQASAEDLKAVLQRYRQAQPQTPTAAVLFSCLGRGEGLYQEPNHDSRVFGAEIGAIPLGGFFCNGEIGPVGTATFLHGYTSAFGLLRAR
ncbi:MAG TPA: hypothetical protein DCQ32_04960 [Cyanobacteria bacterium UBA8156]|nr:hypothetical protein [Cyanobacteria bacterium UBA8156]